MLPDVVQVTVLVDAVLLVGLHKVDVDGRQYAGIASTSDELRDQQHLFG